MQDLYKTKGGEVMERLFKIGDKVSTIVTTFNKDDQRFGVVAYIHPTEKYAPYIVDFGDTWAGFGEHQLQLDKK
jgi:hypothetical protein